MKRYGSQGWLTLAGVLAGLGVALGAFGAHALKPVLPLQAMTIFETAVRYHLLHSLALLGCGLAMEVFPARAARLRWSAGLFVVGIVLFSGSLYGLAMSDVTVLGLLTPLGGVAWVAAWGWLAWTFGQGRGTPPGIR